MKNSKEDLSVGDWIFQKEDLIKNNEKAVHYSVKNIQKTKEKGRYKFLRGNAERYKAHVSVTHVVMKSRDHQKKQQLKATSAPHKQVK